MAKRLDRTVWTALVTPMDADGVIDLDTMARLAQRQADAGNGIVLLGSTGEGLALSLVEKSAIVEHICGLGLSVPIMVGVGGFALTEQLKWLDTAAQFGADAFLMPVPLYAKPGLQGQLSWFSALLMHAKRPCMIYNTPRAGVALHPDVLTAIEHLDMAWAVKESSGSVAQFTAYRQAAPSLAFFSGDDVWLRAFVEEGACGLISVAGNAWPAAVAKMVQIIMADTSVDDSLWRAACDSLFVASNPVPVKLWMAKHGMMPSATVRPPLSCDDCRDLGVVESAASAFLGSMK